MLKNVVLPAPFGPIRLTIDPSGIVKSMSLTATSPPNSLRTSTACSSSVIRQIFLVRMHGLARDVELKAVGRPLLELLPVPALGDQARRPEQHHQDDDRPVDPELVLGRVEVDPGLVELR